MNDFRLKARRIKFRLNVGVAAEGFPAERPAQGSMGA
jgi:hypothetical protein